MFVPPIVVTDYPEGNEDFRKLLEEVRDGRIGHVLKQLVRKELRDSFDIVLADLDEAHRQAERSLSKLKASIEDFRKESFLDAAEGLYSPVLAANMAYALRSLAILLSLFSAGIKQWPQIPDNMKKNSIQELKKAFEHLDLTDAEEMPDAVRATEEMGQETGLAFLLFDISLFMTAVVFVGVLVNRNERLTAPIVETLERLLRDWTQEIRTQLAILAEQNYQGTDLVKLRGIIPDAEDFEIVEEVNIRIHDDGLE